MIMINVYWYFDCKYVIIKLIAEDRYSKQLMQRVQSGSNRVK